MVMVFALSLSASPALWRTEPSIIMWRWPELAVKSASFFSPSQNPEVSL
jgi:hypothetical protein